MYKNMSLSFGISTKKIESFGFVIEDYFDGNLQTKYLRKKKEALKYTKQDRKQKLRISAAK